MYRPINVLNINLNVVVHLLVEIVYNDTSVYVTITYMFWSCTLHKVLLITLHPMGIIGFSVVLVKALKQPIVLLPQLRLYMFAHASLRSCNDTPC